MVASANGQTRVDKLVRVIVTSHHHARKRLMKRQLFVFLTLSSYDNVTLNVAFMSIFSSFYTIL